MGTTDSVKELADALVADGRYFQPIGGWDSALATYHAGEYQLTVVDAFEEAAEKGLPMQEEFQRAAVDLIIDRPGADEIDVENLTIALDQIRAADSA
ncbi:hypothetical protein [Rhodococcus spongiicola]|uniref:Uncharacterized protein n=1 Tax=Rhodococcus spongiicola TaxID=2487352 RepID=A0A3S3ZIG1_9NOCA|nr:hypothetical protein [Rhodococcus spongiicola]RVW01490.1 hypothetical protein EF834_13680 [Rhodococcus spongiicola]